MENKLLPEDYFKISYIKSLEDNFALFPDIYKLEIKFLKKFNRPNIELNVYLFEDINSINLSILKNNKNNILNSNQSIISNYNNILNISNLFFSWINIPNYLIKSTDEQTCNFLDFVEILYYNITEIDKNITEEFLNKYIEKNYIFSKYNLKEDIANFYGENMIVRLQAQEIINKLDKLEIIKNSEKKYINKI